MLKSYIKAVIQLLILVFVQVVCFNHIRLFEYFLPIVYLYPLLKMPCFTSRTMLTLLGAATGLLVDAFMNTPGLNMAITTLVAYLRNPILRAIVGDDVNEYSDENPEPSLTTIKSYKYLLYLLIMVALHISLLLLLEAFSLDQLVRTLPYVGGALLVSLPIMLVFDAFGRSSR